MSDKPSTMSTLFDHLMKKPETDSPFEVGQKVKVLKKVLEDGQTPEFWTECLVEVISVGATMLHKEWTVTLKHPNGATDRFKAEELDWRYIKNRKNKVLR